MLFRHIPRVLSASLLILACLTCTFTVRSGELPASGGMERVAAATSVLPLFAAGSEAGKRFDPPAHSVVILPAATVRAGGVAACQLESQQPRSEFLTILLNIVYTEVVSSRL